VPLELNSLGFSTPDEGEEAIEIHSYCKLL